MVAGALFYISCCGAAEREDSRMDYARTLLHQSPAAKQVELKIDAGLGNSEAFSIRNEAPGTTILGGGAAGVLYGVQQWLGSPQPLRSAAVERPDFELRGGVLYLMKDASYDYQLTPEEIPWFYDRSLLTTYLDYLFANRFNTIFLWSGHLFPSIASMPEYPDATDLRPAELARNQQQFRWFTGECAKRNISVLLHFYQIHLPKPLAKSRGIPVHYHAPTAFAAKFVRYSLLRFLTEFDSVGLYVCPGEQLAQQYTAPWIRDVILAAARQSGKHPRIVVRYWGLDAPGFKRLCAGQYDNFYTEMKHNVEMVVSPVPDPRHASCKNVAKKHIVNLHEMADLKPFRWGSPHFVQEMVGEWKKAGIDGAEMYCMVSWRWPYALDKLEPQQDSLWPAGRKLLTFQRDAIWLEAAGRYLWKVDRDRAAEDAYWTARLAEKFGTRQAGDLIRRWYDTSGPILPGLQNLTRVRNMNYFPTAVGAEQRVDWVLAADYCTDYVRQPVDTYFFRRYKQKYQMPELVDRRTMGVAEYADRLISSAKPPNVMTPDKVLDLLAELADESLALARQARQCATVNRDECARFGSDSQALVYVVQAWRHKVLAAVEKRAILIGGGPEHQRAFLAQLDDSIAVYKKLVAVTDPTYVKASDMLAKLNWHAGLQSFVTDAKQQTTWLRQFETARQAGAHWIEAEYMEGKWKLGADYQDYRPYHGYSGSGFRVCHGPADRGTALRTKVLVDHAGHYVVWARGLLTAEATHAFIVEVAGQKLPPAHGEQGMAKGEFVWRNVGGLELRRGMAEIVVRDAGGGYACPDVIVLARGETWQPPR